MAAHDNPNYRLILTSASNNLSVTATLPQTFDFDSSSDYDTPFAGGVLPPTAKLIGRLTTGSSATTSIMSMQVWQGTAPINISFPFVFAANEDPVKEVVEPIKRLVKLTLPSRAAKFLISPGPRLAKVSDIDITDIFTTIEVTNKISLAIGNFMLFPSVIVTGVSQQYDTRFDSRGQPIKATVNVSFRTFLTPTVEDIDDYYIGA